jgi:hypothetical protein
MHGPGQRRELPGTGVLDVRLGEVSSLVINDLLIRKGYINSNDLKEVFELLGETVNPDEL